MFDFDTLRPHAMVEPEGIITRRKDLRLLAFTTPVRKLLVGQPVVLAPETSVALATEILRTRKTRTALVVCSDSLLGIVTQTEILTELHERGADPHQLSVWQAMTPEPPFCLANDSVASALRLFKTYGVQALPVMQPDGPPIGVLDATQITAWLSDLLTVVALD